MESLPNRTVDGIDCEAFLRQLPDLVDGLRRAVYHHTFRLGTLAFRALGPTEAAA